MSLANPQLSAETWRKRLAAHATAVLAEGGVEDVHQLRVCSARLLVWLRLARVRALRDDLRWLRKSAAGVRDLDVQLAAEPPQRVRRGLARQRQVALDVLRDTLRTDRFVAIQHALSLLPPAAMDQTLETLAAQALRAVKLGRQQSWHKAAADPISVSGSKHALHRLHALRRCVRRVRYVLQLLERDAHTVTDFQDVLGEVCDRAMALHAQCDEHGAARYHRRLQQQLQLQLRLATQGWKHARPVLENLSHEVVHHPSRPSGSRVRHIARSGAAAH